MLNMILKGSLIFTLPILVFNVQANANSTPGKEVLARQCKELADTVSSLVSSQQKNTCVDKLLLAVEQITTARDMILENANLSAKKELDKSVYTLQYAELNSCNRYIQISHSKFEARRIRNTI